MKKYERLTCILKKISGSIIFSIILLLAVIFLNKGILPEEFLIYEAIPFYTVSANSANIYASFTTEPETDETVYIHTDGISFSDLTEPPPVVSTGLVGLSDISYEAEQSVINLSQPPAVTALSDELAKLNDFNYLSSNYYSHDPDTIMLEKMFDIGAFLNTNLKITPSDSEPKVIIFHTHSRERYIDSNPEDLSEGVVGLGQKLSELLLSKYGIKSIHVTDSFDVVDGKIQIGNAYERMEDTVSKIIRDNPSIEVAIDIHRDGIRDDMKIQANVNRETVAPIMLVNGLSTRYVSGEITSLNNLKNEYQQENLAFSLRMKLAANSMYPGFMRKIYLKAYRYSLNMLPKSLLVEVGAQTNTKAEAFAAIEPLAEILASVILE